MWEEHLRIWLSALSQKSSPDNTQSRKFVALIHMYLWKVHLSEECIWYTVIIITKSHCGFCVVSLVKVLQKNVTGIMNFRITSAIDLHNTLHGFCAVRGQGNASLKANLLQQLTEMREQILYEIFLYIHKAYDILNRDRCLDILAGYGMEPWYLCLPRRYC